MIESTHTEETRAGKITYKYLSLRPSKPHIQIINVSMALPSGIKVDITNGFFSGNAPIIPAALETELLFHAGKGE